VVYVAGSDGKVGVRTVQVGERAGTMWLIQDGLKTDERVIVEGQQNLKPGMPVQTRPFKGNTE
jgi:membrane fusion protein (multidrug efflux system)